MHSTSSVAVKTPGEVIKSLVPGGGFHTLSKVRPSGSLQARRAKNGAVTFYWRYTFDGRSERLAIGQYNSRIPPKALEPVNGEFSVAAAERAAQALALHHEQSKGEGGLRAKREREDDERKQAQVESERRAAAVAAAQHAERLATEARQRYTLAALCDQYVAHLKSQGKLSSAYDARNIFQNHLVKRAPNLANMPACDMGVEALTDLLRAMNEKGIGRTANKLRSYLGSAFNHGLRARFDPAVPLAFKSFGITANPVMSTFRIKGADGDAKNPLLLADLRRYWHALRDVEGVRGAVLRLHVLTGGQRITQLLRVARSADFGDKIRLLDTKGKREKAREHFVPLLPEARKDLDYLAAVSSGPFLFSTSDGEKAINPMTLTNWAIEVAQAAEISDFEPKRVRSGIETVLASRRVSSDVRAQLQSHGLGGVQQRHYDGHDYHEEKLNALQLLLGVLAEEEVSNVISMSPRRLA